MGKGGFVLDISLEKLVRQLKKGNADAFDHIYQMTYRKIFFVVLPIVRDKSLAEDIMQDTYLKFLEKLYDYQNNNTLAYILTIAKNLAKNEYNRRKREQKVEPEEMTNFGFDDYIEIKEENRELINKGLSVLNAAERNIVLLHVLEGLKHKDIAMILDMPLGTVTWSYQQALKKMRQVLKGEQ